MNVLAVNRNPLLFARYTVRLCFASTGHHCSPRVIAERTPAIVFIGSSFDESTIRRVTFIEYFFSVLDISHKYFTVIFYVLLDFCFFFAEIVEEFLIYYNILSVFIFILFILSMVYVSLLYFIKFIWFQFHLLSIMRI